MKIRMLSFLRILCLALAFLSIAPAQAVTNGYVLKVAPGSKANMSGGFAGWVQDFALSGTFQATVTDGSSIQFANIDVVATALNSANNQYPPGTVINFTSLPTFPGTYDGLNFAGSLTNGPSYAGTFNGSLLSMNGQSLPPGTCCDQITTVYSIGATVVPVTNPPIISGVWPDAGVTNTPVFVFGKNFIVAPVPPATTSSIPIVKFNNGTLVAPIVQVVGPEILFALQPPNTVQGKITVTTSAGTGISPTDYNVPVPPPGLRINGLWPGESKVGGGVVIFGQGFSPIPGGNRITVNGISIRLVQALDTNILFFLVPSGATTGKVCVTTGGQTACSPDDLFILP